MVLYFFGEGREKKKEGKKEKEKVGKWVEKIDLHIAYSGVVIELELVVISRLKMRRDCIRGG